MVSDPIKRRRSVKRASLAVWMNGNLVGTWAVRKDRAPSFEYDPAWVSSAAGRTLSLSLPFQPGNAVLSGDAVSNYFDNLLPDSKEIRQRLQRRFKISSTEAFDLLYEIGRDCVGAVQLLPVGEEPTGVQQIDAQPLSDEDVAKHLAAVAATPIPGLADDDDFRISIAGAQEKTALLLHQGQWCHPHHATPTTHILKLPLGLVGNMRADFSTSVENEWLCSKIIAAYGLPSARCDVRTFGDKKTLVVERFDRKLHSSGKFWLRLPQEDMCQATGTPATAKYEPDGGPGMRKILDVLLGSSHALDDRRNFLTTQILFWMLAATDGHAKNFSIFHKRGGAYCATPLYDVLSAWPIIGDEPNQLPWQKAKLAMAVRAANAHYRFRDIQRRHWNEVAQRAGVGADAEGIISTLIQKTPRVITVVSSMLPAGFPAKVADSIFSNLLAQANALNRMPSTFLEHASRIRRQIVE